MCTENVCTVRMCSEDKCVARLSVVKTGVL